MVKIVQPGNFSSAFTVSTKAFLLGHKVKHWKTMKKKVFGQFLLCDNQCKSKKKKKKRKHKKMLTFFMYPNFIFNFFSWIKPVALESDKQLVSELLLWLKSCFVILPHCVTKTCWCSDSDQFYWDEIRELVAAENRPVQRPKQSSKAEAHLH